MDQPFWTLDKIILNKIWISTKKIKFYNKKNSSEEVWGSKDWQKL